MKSDLNGQKIPALLLYIFYIAFFTGLIFSFRAVSSISIGLIFLTTLIKNKLESGYFLSKNINSLFVSGCFALYLLHFIALLYTSNMSEGWSHLQLKSALIFVPLAVVGTDFLNKDIRTKLLLWYCFLLFSASAYCLAASLIRYKESHDVTTLFYHELVSPFSMHSIYFSILIFVALVFLMEFIQKKSVVLNRFVHYSLIAFFSLFLFLLSSRLILTFFSFYIFYYIILHTEKNILKIALVSSAILTGSFVIITNNPVSRRFHDLLNNDLSILKQDRFDPGTYFNGLQFRLLQWKLVPEILTENKAWLIGVSPGDAQAMLDKKYIEKNMYTGDNQRGDKGFLGYNTHNQLLQSLLQCGIIGLCAFLLICISLIRRAIREKNRILSFVTILLLLYSFLESVFETQYGLLLFLFFPLFFNSWGNKINIKNN